MATNWIDDQLEVLKLQGLALATMAGPAMSSLPKNLTADVQHAVNKGESLGPGKQLILHRNPSAIAATLSPAYGNLSMSCFAEHASPVLHVSLGHPRGDFDIFATSGEPTAWVLLWKNRSRPIGVRVCLVAQFDFFSTAFDPRAWRMVVFWKEDSGRQQPICYT